MCLLLFPRAPVEVTLSVCPQVCDFYFEKQCSNRPSCAFPRLLVAQAVRSEACCAPSSCKRSEGKSYELILNPTTDKHVRRRRPARADHC